jgi:hypothetical protein
MITGGRNTYFCGTVEKIGDKFGFVRVDGDNRRIYFHPHVFDAYDRTHHLAPLQTFCSLRRGNRLLFQLRDSHSHPGLPEVMWANVTE